MKKIIFLILASLFFCSYSQSQCNVEQKEYENSEFFSNMIGTWQAVEWYVHDENLLGDRIFNFTFYSNDSIKIEEPGNFLSKGKWALGEDDNSIFWEVENTENSLSGRYDLVDGQLIIAGQGLIGENEYVCLKLKKQD